MEDDQLKVCTETSDSVCLFSGGDVEQTEEPSRAAVMLKPTVRASLRICSG